jgi:hypothetical protein
VQRVRKFNLTKEQDMKSKVYRFYNEKGQLTGYADENYSFVCEYNEQGERIGYANSKGEKSGTFDKK